MLPMLMPIFATYTPIANYSALFSWLPVIMLGILASASLVAVYYVIGVLLGNNRIKASAASEFGQIIGTALLIAAVLWVLGLFNSASFSLTTLLSRSTVYSICGQLANAHIDFISTGQLRSSLNYYICHTLVNPAGSSDITANLDYGLASAYVILANMTNQSLTNLNAVFIFESYTGLLTNLQPFVAVCEPTETCMLSNPYTTEPISFAFKVIYSFNVFKGYNIFRGVIFPMTGQATLMVYMYLLQMIVILILLYGWPYILAGGIILRSFLFTRKTGGLLIAIAVVGLLIYPFLFVFEYVTLSNAPSPIGLYPYANGYGPQQPYQIPQSMQLIGSEDSNPPIYYGSSTFNFFVFPRADYILNYNGCWPTDGSIAVQTLDVFIWYIIPGYSLLTSALSLFTSSFNAYPTSIIPNMSCTPDNVIKSLIAMINLYGWMSVTGVILPLINILISISAVRGLSSLFGGDTNLLGIGKLV